MTAATSTDVQLDQRTLDELAIEPPCDASDCGSAATHVARFVRCPTCGQSVRLYCQPHATQIATEDTELWVWACHETLTVLLAVEALT